MILTSYLVHKSLYISKSHVNLDFMCSLLLHKDLYKKIYIYTKTSNFWLHCLVLLKIRKDSVLLYFCIKFDFGFILLIQKSYSRKKARMVQFLYDLKICLKMKFHQGTVVITVKFETFVFYPREGKRGVGDSELCNK